MSRLRQPLDEFARCLLERGVRRIKSRGYTFVCRLCTGYIVEGEPYLQPWRKGNNGGRRAHEHCAREAARGAA